MAINLSDLRTVRADKPPRVLIYGPPKIGKTTLAAEFPSPVFIQTEEGTPGGTELTAFPQPETLADVMDSIAALFDAHDFKTLVVDSLSSLEPLVLAEVCRRNNWPSIEAPGYGKGYVEADLLWREFMLAIAALRRERDMLTVLIAHSEIKRVEDPIVGPLDRFTVQLHKRAVDIVQKEVDVIAFLNYRIAISETKGKFNAVHRKGIGAGERVIHLADRPGFVAGNRHSLLDEVPYKRGEGFSAMFASAPVAEAAPAEPRRQRRAA